MGTTLKRKLLLVVVSVTVLAAVLLLARAAGRHERVSLRIDQAGPYGCIVSVEVEHGWKLGSLESASGHEDGELVVLCDQVKHVHEVEVSCGCR